MRTIQLLAHIVFAVLMSAPLQGQEMIIVPQHGAPLQITKYEAQFKRRGSYTSEGIHHAVTYRNASQQKIRAVQIGLVSFSIFNKFLDRTGGIDMDELDPGKASSGTWVATALADFSFYTGVAYISTVRFADGTIWEASLDEVMAALTEIEADFDAARLIGEPREQ